VADSGRLVHLHDAEDLQSDDHQAQDRRQEGNLKNTDN
jgi:hypothetical protein